MITKPNPYLQLFFDFLQRNGNGSFVYLIAHEVDDYTVLQYDTDNKYLQNEEFLISLPYQRLYNQIAEEWWALLAKRGLMQSMVSAATETQQQVSSTAKVAKRSIQLDPKAERALYLYLEEQLMGASPSAERRCQYLNELHQVACAFTETLNDRMQQAVQQSLSSNGLDPSSNIALLNVWPWSKAAGKHVDYTFPDGVVVSHVQEIHRRPFSFAGIWVDLPDSKRDHLPVLLGFTDSRIQPVAALYKVQSQELTAQWCLEQGYKRLSIDSQLRQTVEKYGKADKELLAQYWLSSGQLLARLT
jgi:hypothetical protein